MMFCRTTWLRIPTGNNKHAILHAWLGTLHVPKSALIVADTGDTIAGCVEVTATDGVVYIDTLAVSPLLQDNRFGKALLSEAERFARRNRDPTQAVMIGVSVRRELIAFCGWRGYVRTGELMSYLLHAAIWTPRDETLTIEKLSNCLERRRILFKGVGKARTYPGNEHT